jgi:hypothetical protein
MTALQRPNAFADFCERICRLGQHGFGRACGRRGDRQPTEHRLPS